MNSERPGGAEVVVGPSGETLTIDNLPVADTGRWTMRRKAQLIAAVRGGLMTKKEACDRCGISAEELDSWQTLLDQHGLHGLKATSLQKFRGALDRRATPSVDAAARRPLNGTDVSLDNLD